MRGEPDPGGGDGPITTQPPEPKCQPTTVNQLSALLNQLYQL